MQVIELPHGLKDLSPMLNRSPGLHVSEIIHSICVERQIYKKEVERLSKKERTIMDKGLRSSDDDLRSTLMSFGQALEHAVMDMYNTTYPGDYSQPGEICFDDVYGTPDLQKESDSSFIEIKLTKLSSMNRGHSDTYWRFWCQLKAYTHIWNMRNPQMDPVLHGELHIGHMRGNYSTTTEDYIPWRGIFTEKELGENWSMLLRYAKEREMFRSDE